MEWLQNSNKLRKFSNVGKCESSKMQIINVSRDRVRLSTQGETLSNLQWQISKHLNTSTYSCDVGLHVTSLVDASVRNFNPIVFCFPLTGSRCQSQSRVSESEHPIIWKIMFAAQLLIGTLWNTTWCRSRSRRRRRNRLERKWAYDWPETLPSIDDRQSHKTP